MTRMGLSLVLFLPFAAVSASSTTTTNVVSSTSLRQPLLTLQDQPKRLPFLYSSLRGGGDDDEGNVGIPPLVSSIPAGGASSYSNQLESVKANVLKAAFESVRVWLASEST